MREHVKVIFYKRDFTKSATTSNMCFIDSKEILQVIKIDCSHILANP